MKKYSLIIILPVLLLAAVSCSKKSGEFRKIDAAVLKDKIAGGWAGKMASYLRAGQWEQPTKTIELKPSILGKPVAGRHYVQLTFLMTMDKYGIDAL